MAELTITERIVEVETVDIGTVKSAWNTLQETDEFQRYIAMRKRLGGFSEEVMLFHLFYDFGSVIDKSNSNIFSSQKKRGDMIISAFYDNGIIAVDLFIPSIMCSFMIQKKEFESDILYPTRYTATGFLKAN
jgi:hypothetical protein